MARATISHAATTTAAPAEVWPLYENVARWHEWDGGVSGVELHGPFEAGTRGRVTLPNGRRGRLRLLDVRPGASFTDAVHAPLLRITTTHELVADGHGTRITHTVRLGGVLGRLFPRLTAIPVRAALPASVAQLALLASREHVA